MTDTATYLVPTATNVKDLLALGDDALFTEPALRQALTLLESKAGGLTADVSTEDGRREITALSRGVGGAIARLDDRRKAFVGDLKARPARIDKLFREVFRQPAEAIKDAIRAPLEAWDQEQREIAAEVEAVIADMSAPIEAGTSPAVLADRLNAAMDVELREWWSAEQRDAVAAAQAAAIPRLQGAYDAAVLAAAQAAELAKLRAESEARERADREARIAAEAAERAKAEAAKAQQRIEAAERAQKEAERRAQQEAAAAEERQRLAVIAERTRAERDAERDAARKAQDEAKRRADTEHAAAINRRVRAALIEIGLSEDLATVVVVHLATGKIPHASIQY